MFDYIRSRDSADRLMARFGRPSVLRHRGASGPAYDPVIGRPDDQKVSIVTASYSDFEVGQGRVKTTDLKVFMSAGGLKTGPELDDTLVIDGVEHKLVGPDVGRGIKPIAPAGIVVLYELQCRK